MMDGVREMYLACPVFAQGETMKIIFGQVLDKRFAITASAIILCVIVSLCILYICLVKNSRFTLSPGDTASKFAHTTVTGEKISLASFEGEAVLLLFLDLQADFSSDASIKSRGQVTFAKSMHTQYDSVGLHVVIVDSGQAREGKKDIDTLRIFSLDQQLEAISLVADDRYMTIAKSFSVQDLPTSFLIDKAGIVNQRWDGFALTSQFALAIENLLGSPAYRKDYASGDGSFPDAGDTAALAVFPGLLPARPLSQEIWLVDGGKPWKSAEEYPLRWLVLNEGKEADLEILSENTITGEKKVLIKRKKMESLSDREVVVILSNSKNKSLHVFLLDTFVLVEKPGLYKISAMVYEKDLSSQISGEALITVKP